MLDEMKVYLKVIQSKVVDECLCKDILKKISLLNVTEMSKDRMLIADLFCSVLQAIQENKINELEKEIIEAFKNISQIARTGKENSSLVIIDFLNHLYQHRNYVHQKIDISQDEILILLKDMEAIKFVLLICDEDGERYFPANRLLSNIVLDVNFINSRIEPYHINLLQLAVEMFKITGEVDPQEQFERLINTCNLHFIRYLDGTSTRIDTIDMTNYKYNNVMVFYNEREKKVLIRHENLSYFDILSNEVHINHEINAQGREIGYSVELSVEGIVLDYSEAIKESPIELLKLLYSKKCKNVMIEKMIVKTPEGKYEPLNPFCVNDQWIIKGRINQSKGKCYQLEQIIDCIDEGRLQMLSTCAKCGGINQISFGLCLFLLEKELVDIDKMFSNVNKDECLQNSVIRNWVELTTNKLESLEFVLRKWMQDLEYCNDRLLKDFTFDNRRIRDTFPFVLSLDWIYKMLEMPTQASVFIGTISYEKEDKYYIDFSPRANISLAKKLHDEIHSIYSSEVIFSEDTVIEEILHDENKGYFLLKDGTWYFDISLQNILKIIVSIELLNDSLLHEEILRIFSEELCQSIFSIMDLHSEELLDVNIKKMDKDSMFRYRLLHNVLFNNINAETSNDYINIFLKHQILNFKEIGNDDLFAKDGLSTLVVPKDNINADASLRKIYDKYLRKHSKRDTLWWYFPKDLSCESNIYYKDGNKLSVMRFLFDNIEHGTATIRTLAIYLGKEKEWIEFEIQRTKSKINILEQKIEMQKSSVIKYNVGSNVVEPKDIYIANSPKIEVHSYFGTNEGDQLIKDFLEYCKINESEYSVSHSYDIICKPDRIEKECVKLGLDYKRNNNIYLVIREFNMPKRNLLPKGTVGNADNVITLLVKKKEIN